MKSDVHLLTGNIRVPSTLPECEWIKVSDDVQGFVLYKHGADRFIGAVSEVIGGWIAMSVVHQGDMPLMACRDSAMQAVEASLNQYLVSNFSINDLPKLRSTPTTERN